MANHSFTFIAGAYRMTYDGNPLGQTEDGIRFETVQEGETISGDNMADSIQDIVFRGGNCFLETVFTESSKTALRSLIWPWDANFGQVGVIGLLAGATFAKVLVMTKVSGTSAQFGTITADRAILVPGFPVQTLLAPRLERVPIRLQLLPYGNLDAEKWFDPVAAT